jgi:dipeptide/tripeptide permease
MPVSDQEKSAPKPKFPRSFWTANSIELFERAAYYSMASFMVIYLHETLGMRPAFATLLNGSVLWGLIYFLPILSGTLADKFGFKRSLTVSFVMISLGYIVMGNIQRFWPALSGKAGSAAIDYTIPAVMGIVLIGVGGSVVKPCIAGTVQKTSGLRATLGFGIFYMVINIGSMTGRGVSYFIRTNLGIPAIFTYAATVFALIGLAVVLFLYKEPEYVSDGKKDDQKVEKRTLGQAVLGIFVVLSNLKFVFFLVVIGLFWFLYVQLYNLMPLFLRYIDPNAPVEIYTLANPVMIVCFQLLITRMVKKWTPVKSILLGVA